MLIPGWLWQLLMVTALGGVVLAAQGIGRACRRVVPNWIGVAAAGVAGGGLGFGVGAGFVWLVASPSVFDSIFTYAGGFFAAFAGLAAATSAAGMRARWGTDRGQ